MHINNRKTRYTIIYGILFMHVLIICECGFFVKRFIVSTYDPDPIGGGILIAALIGMVAAIDFLLAKGQTFQRCFLKVRMDTEGIEWYIFRTHKTQLKWSQIRTYGITGYERPNQPFAFMFFSGDPDESRDLKKIMSFSKQRIVMQIRDDTFQALRQYQPNDMGKLIRYIECKQDCYFRR